MVNIDYIETSLKESGLAISGSREFVEIEYKNPQVFKEKTDALFSFSPVELYSQFSEEPEGFGERFGRYPTPLTVRTVMSRQVCKKYPNVLRINFMESGVSLNPLVSVLDGFGEHLALGIRMEPDPKAYYWIKPKSKEEHIKKRRLDGGWDYIILRALNTK